MFDFTRFSFKTPKSRRPEEKKEYSLASSLKKKPTVLDKNKKLTLGRASKNNLVLKEGTISEIHASIKWDKSAFKVKDESSTNGTFVNNKRIEGVHALKNGDRIKIGKYVLRFGIKKVREKKEDKPVVKSKKKTRAGIKTIKKTFSSPKKARRIKRTGKKVSSSARKSGSAKRTKKKTSVSAKKRSAR